MSKRLPYFVVGTLIILGVALIIVIASLIIRYPSINSFNFRNTPARPSITETITPTTDYVVKVNTATPLPPSTKTVGELLVLQPTATVKGPGFTPSEALTPTTSHTQTSNLCDANKDIIIYLLIASESNTGALNVAMVRYIKYDYLEKELKILAIPSDIHLSGQVISRLNLNSISVSNLFDYSYQNILSVEENNKQIAVNITAQALYENINIVPDFFILLEEESFSSILDLIGPITIEIDNKFTALSEMEVWGMISDTTVSNSDKLETQNSLISAVHQQLYKPGFISVIPDLKSQLLSTSISNITPFALDKMICLFGTIPVKDVAYLIPGSRLYKSDLNGQDLLDGKKIQAWLKLNF